MIKIVKANKYYYKGKPNQIHVIDNTSIELPNKGMVCLLGPSGCGKTTLLNVVGGLDTLDSGIIQIDDDYITGKTSGQVDEIRNQKIGYIFQNFNLIDDISVYENIAIALRLVGIKDETVIENRINYCLKSVGIYQYRKKKAGSLSGGQRQRVAIARALVKNPSIIIADEPTGNLDSANTLEIMNIIKSISRDKLVVLVTHEQKIAGFYADHIAEISDGKIVKAYSNDSSKYLDCRLDNKIYLKDMDIQKSYGEDFEIYSDRDIDTKIKIVIRDGNLYIDTNGRFNLVGEDANIDLVDDSYKAMDESFYEETDFEYAACLPENFEPKYSSLYGFKSTIKNGWSNVKNFKKIKKFLLIGFVFAAMFVVFAISNIMGIVNVDPKDYTKSNLNYVTVSNPNMSKDLMDLIASLDGVQYVLAGNTKKSVTLKMDDYYQTAFAKTSLNVSIAETKVLKKDNIIYGELPKKKNEIVIDKMIVDDFLNDKLGLEVGLTDIKHFIGRKIEIKNLGDFVIVGISDLSSPCLYIDESCAVQAIINAEEAVDETKFVSDDEEKKLEDVAYGVSDIALAEGKLSVTEGKLPEKDYEVIVNENMKGEYSIGNKIDTKMNSQKLEVVGFYSNSDSGDNKMYVTTNTMYLDYIGMQTTFTVYDDNPRLLEATLQTKDITCQLNSELEKTAYINQMKNALTSAFIVAGIILLISLIEMYLMLRASFMSRIKNVGVLRAIGLKKTDIYKMFSGEILVITFITAIPGIAIMYLLLNKMVDLTVYFAGMYMVTPLVALVSLLIIVLFNLLAGLIPVARTLRKTPAEILSRIDI